MGDFHAGGVYHDDARIYFSSYLVFWWLANAITKYVEPEAGRSHNGNWLGCVLVGKQSFCFHFCTNVDQVDLSEAKGGPINECVMEVPDTDSNFDPLSGRYLEDCNGVEGKIR